MALGTPAPGSVVILHVGATSTPVTPVGGNKTWNHTAKAPQATHDYYGQPSVISVGKKSRTMAIDVDYETLDSGHQVLYAAFISGATIWAKILPDGTNGETLPVKISDQVINGGDVNNHTNVTWTLAQQGDPATVGTGFGT